MYGKSRAGIGLPPLTDDEGILLAKPGGGKYTDMSLQGELFMACNQAHVTTCTTNHDTFTGLAITNPTASGKNFIMHEFSYAMMDSPAGDTNLSLIIAALHSGFGADITIRCTFWGHATSVALASDSATITGTTGVLVKHICTLGTNLTTDLLNGPTVVDLGGAIIVPPGYSIYTDSLLASGDVMLFGFMWQEVDV